MFYDRSYKTLLLAGQNANLKLATSYLHIFLFIHFVSQLAGVGFLLGSLKGQKSLIVSHHSL